MSDAPVSLPLLLLIEDEPLLASTLSQNLENQFEIDVASNVEEAQALFNTRKYDVILSDHMLPGKKQGLDFLIEALERRPETKRILMTGYLNPELLTRGVALAQLSACLIKPVEIMRLRKELDEALGRR